MATDKISISKFSFMTRLTQKALHLYDEKGILFPQEKNKITGYRYYSISHIETGLKIKTYPAGKFLSYNNKGSYYQLFEKYTYLFKYAEEHDMKITSPNRELYLNDPSEIKEDEIQISIQERIFSIFRFIETKQENHRFQPLDESPF